MPFEDSLFMPREIGDRPKALPKDCVFTVEYLVRTTQMAVYGSFETGKKYILL